MEKRLSLSSAIAFSVDTVFQHFAFFVLVILVRTFLGIASALLFGIIAFSPMLDELKRFAVGSQENGTIEEAIKNINPHNVHKIINAAADQPWQVILAVIICCILFFLFNQFLSLGYNKIELNFYDKKQNSLGVLFSQARLTLPAAIASLLFAGATILGSVFFLLPGFIFGVTFGFYQMVMVDEGLGIFAAFKRAAQLTRGVRWPLLAFHLSSGVVYALFAQYFFPVLLFFGPVISLIPPFAYKKLKEQMLVKE